MQNVPLTVIAVHVSAVKTFYQSSCPAENCQQIQQQKDAFHLASIHLLRAQWIRVGGLKQPQHGKCSSCSALKLESHTTCKLLSLIPIPTMALCMGTGMHVITMLPANWSSSFQGIHLQVVYQHFINLKCPLAMYIFNCLQPHNKDIPVTLVRMTCHSYAHPLPTRITCFQNKFGVAEM